MKKIVFTFILVYSCFIYSQKEANIWYFGRNAGLDFNSGSPVALIDGVLTAYEGCSTMSDSNGNLLFYTNGVKVYNRNHILMPQGDAIGGNISSTNSSIIVPNPINPNLYYIFVTSDGGGPLGYRVVNMSLDNGLGNIEGNYVLLQNNVSEKLTAVKHANGKDYWVISHRTNGNNFISFQVSSMGVNITPVISSIGRNVNGFGTNLIGAIKVSPNGKRLAVANQGYNDAELFDFNTNTGIVSNTISIPMGDTTILGLGPYGVEFSPNSNVLYVSTIIGAVYQYDLSKLNQTEIINSRLRVSKNEGYTGALQLATDKKIYVSRQSDAIDIINNPDIIGSGCDYKDRGLYLAGRKGILGLPSFIQSYFRINKFTFESTCFGDATQFLLINTVDSVVWNFGDIVSGVNNTSTSLAPLHTFSKPGDYIVTVTAIVGAETVTTTSKVTIYEVPTATQPTAIKICDDNNDGFYSFDLTTQNATILNGQDPLIFGVKYYAGLVNFNNNIEITTPNNYTNQTAYTLETIYAKVYNINSESCFDSTNFTIQVSETPLPSTTISPLTECDNTSVGTDNDGIILFDLTQKETVILNGQVASNFTIEYYSDAGFLSQIANPAAFQNTTNPQTVYVKMFNKTNNSCDATTSFNVEVFKLPTINSPVVLKQCDDNTDGFSAFNLTEVENEISTNASNLTFTYFKTLADANSNNTANKILNTTTYINQNVSTDKVWASVENNNGCYSVAEIDLIVSTTGIPVSFQKVFYECDDFVDAVNNEKDGITAFNFSSVTQDIKNIFPVGQQLIINYYRNEADALAEENPILDTANYRNIGYPTTQTIYVRVDSKLDNDCLGLGGHITLNVEPIPIANPVTINRQCDDDFDGFYPFDTAIIEATVLNGQTGMQVSYIDENGNALPSPLPNPFLTNSQTITIRVTDRTSNDPDGACDTETTLEFTVDKKPVANPVTDFMECDDDVDGLFPFDTATIETTILNGQTGMLVSYMDENGNSLSSPLPNPFLTGSTTITAKVENELNGNCAATTIINFVVHPKPEFELDEQAIVCLNILPKQLSISNPKEDNYSFTWTNEQGVEISNQPQAEIAQGGIYTVIATSINGCKSYPQEIKVLESNIATITTEQIEITDDATNNIISIETSSLGIGDYEYAIQKDGEPIGFYQEEPIFENISAGIYTVYVRDKNNCGSVAVDVSVIGYPKFFTPNNDGHNDYWNVIGVNSNFYSNSFIYIYNRFGKLIIKVDPTTQGWDGYFNGAQLPSSDYWFTVELVDIKGSRKIRKGHFSLIRK
jgi:gliding motility-associated-like protein